MPKNKHKSNPKVKLNWVQRLKKRVKAYFAAQKKGGKKPKTMTTDRTKFIEKQLRLTGMREKEIARMRSKKRGSHNPGHKSSGGY